MTKAKRICEEPECLAAAMYVTEIGIPRGLPMRWTWAHCRKCGSTRVWCPEHVPNVATTDCHHQDCFIVACQGSPQPHEAPANRCVVCQTNLTPEDGSFWQHLCGPCARRGLESAALEAWMEEHT
jgi:hypothetical protein